MSRHLCNKKVLNYICISIITLKRKRNS